MCVLTYVCMYVYMYVGPFLDETPREIKNTANKPPVFFLGRNAKVQEVSHSLTHSRSSSFSCVLHMYLYDIHTFLRADLPNYLPTYLPTGGESAVPTSALPLCNDSRGARHWQDSSGLPYLRIHGK